MQGLQLTNSITNNKKCDGDNGCLKKEASNGSVQSEKIKME